MKISNTIKKKEWNELNKKEINRQEFIEGEQSLFCT